MPDHDHARGADGRHHDQRAERTCHGAGCARLRSNHRLRGPYAPYSISQWDYDELSLLNTTSGSIDGAARRGLAEPRAGRGVRPTDGTANPCPGTNAFAVRCNRRRRPQGSGAGFCRVANYGNSVPSGGLDDGDGLSRSQGGFRGVDGRIFLQRQQGHHDVRWRRLAHPAPASSRGEKAYRGCLCRSGCQQGLAPSPFASMPSRAGAAETSERTS